MKKLLVPTALALLLAAGWYVWKGRAAEAPTAASATLAAVERRNLDVVAEAAGQVEPIRVVEVKSKASGEVLRVLFETGDVVEEGALLAEIEPRDVQNALAQAEAELEAVQVTLSTADAQRKRMEALRESGVVTQAEYEAAVEGAASARSAVVRARTNLQLARERRGDVTIRAPIQGTLLERTVEPGGIIASATSNVSGGTTLFKMADLSRMQVRAKVDETDIGRVVPGQQAHVTVEAYPGRVFQGVVRKIEPQAVVDQNVTLFPVLIQLENPEGLLKPGMNAEVQVRIVSRPNVLAVPSSAVVALREARSAAAALGLSEEAVRQALRPAAAPAAPAPREGVVAAAGDACRPLRQKVREAGGPAGLSEEERGQLEACRARARAARGEAGPAVGTEGPLRPGVVFVQGAKGPEVRRVLLGVSDWEYTEVAEGLSDGEQVVLVSVAQLQQKQKDMSERIRQNAGPMGGGGRMGGGGGRGRRGG